MTVKELEAIYNDLLHGSLRSLITSNYVAINKATLEFIANQNPSADQLRSAELILLISNIIYNNSTRRPFLDDSTYDILLESYRNRTGTYPVGAPPVTFREIDYGNTVSDDELKPFYRKIIPDTDSTLFYEDIQRQDITPNQILRPIYRFNVDTSKIGRDTAHNYPELVGTLDKCKFVTNADARYYGVFDDPSVKVFERDFIQEHLERGIITPDEKFALVLELKYDGISVEADVTDHVISARTRGDTENDLAADLTPILNGYYFFNSLKEPMGVKFEAIITHYNLAKLSRLKGKTYKNARNAVVGIVGALDGPQYRDLITLVPLACTTQEGYPFKDRVEEIEFMNRFFNAGINLKYAVVYGTYIENLYAVSKFVKEAEYLRPTMPFMYDGVVVSYLDRDKIAKLGRKNSVNKWSIAIKFPALKAETVFTGYDYTVGQNGTITPMINYLPVEFFGTIHTKSSGHSFSRFNDLQLRKGDIVQVEYRNDVMPYVTKSDCYANTQNRNPLEEFPKTCPSCGSPLVYSDSGKTVVCPNIKCPERNLMRMTSFLDKLNIKDFSSETLRRLEIYSFKDLVSKGSDISYTAPLIGEVNSKKLYNVLADKIFNGKYFDYELMGSIGFTSIAKNKWKLILSKYTIQEILEMASCYGVNIFVKNVSKIPGIGETIAITIYNELPVYMEDITAMISSVGNIMHDDGSTSMKIRFTGFRDFSLVQQVKSINPSIDIGEGSVTKDTNYLLIPGESYASTKVDKALKYGVKIVPVNEFRSNIYKYLNVEK